MTALSKTAASLRIFGDDLNPDDVTVTLGKKPDVAERAGETIRMPSGRERIARRGRWSIKVGRRVPGDLDGQIAELLAGTTEDVAAWQQLTSKYHADIFCGLFMKEGNEGLTLSAKTLKQIGERGIELGFDIYSAERAADD